MNTMRCRSVVTAALLSAAAGVPARPARAQWTVIDLTPPGIEGSFAYAIRGDTQAGSAGGHAGLWHGTAESFVDLNPPGAESSWITAISEDQQVGTARINGAYYLGVWSGTPQSWVPLSGPDPCSNCSVMGAVAAGVQVGQHDRQALLWRGTPECGQPDTRRRCLLACVGR